MVTSKLASVSLFTILVQRGGGGAMMGIYLESHVTEIMRSFYAEDRIQFQHLSIQTTTALSCFW